MSYVTDVVIQVPLDYQGKLKAHLMEFEWEGRRADVQELNRDLAGGSKVMGGCHYAGGFNYLPSEEFIAHLAAFDWPYPSETVVTIHPEQGSLIVWTPVQPDLKRGYYFDGAESMRFVVGTEEASLVVEVQDGQ